MIPDDLMASLKDPDALDPWEEFLLWAAFIGGISVFVVGSMAYLLWWTFLR